MKIDLLSQYASIREELRNEKAQLEQRLQAINEALGSNPETVSSSPATKTGRGRRGGAPDGKSLKSLVLQVLRDGPMSKDEILSAVQKVGYRFSSKNPGNSLGIILYGKEPRLDRANGKFGLPSGLKNPTSSNAGTADKRKRQMSSAGRKRIAEAARKRWAAAKAAGKKSL